MRIHLDPRIFHSDEPEPEVLMAAIMDDIFSVAEWTLMVMVRFLANRITESIFKHIIRNLKVFPTDWQSFEEKIGRESGKQTLFTL